tara:strand:+ start:171 stop:1004 length:834 start_codon:yes stop_codon:yes gene_type:complete
LNGNLKENNNKGFSLIELVVVVAVLAILSAIAIPSFICFPKRARATAALAALRQINTECALKEAEAKPEIFTSSALYGYTIQTSGSNSCAGSNGVISAVPDNTNELPTFNLIFETGSLTYDFKGKTGNDLKYCLGLICGNSDSFGSNGSDTSSNDINQVSYPEEIDTCTHRVMTSNPGSANGAKVFCGADGNHASEKAYKWHCELGSSFSSSSRSHHQGICNRAKDDFGCEWDAGSENFKLSDDGKTCAEKMNEFSCAPGSPTSGGCLGEDYIDPRK